MAWAGDVAGGGQIEGASLELSVGSAWQGLNKHLIAHIYPVIQVGEGDNRRYEKDGNTSVHAPLIDGSDIEYVFNWQSPFENSGTNSKAPALLAMLQSGYLSGLVEMTKSLTGTTSEAQRQEGNSMLDLFKGRTGLTKLNSTQVFSDMRLHGSLHSLRLWVVLKQLHNHRILHRSHVHLNVRFVILI